MRASVVVPTYQRPKKLLATVETLRAQTIDDYEVLVVDDGSDTESQEDVLERIDGDERVRVLRQENSGPAAARNRGWRAASSEFVLFTDDDCLVPGNWVESLINGFEPGIGAVGGPCSRPKIVAGRVSSLRCTPTGIT